MPEGLIVRLCAPTLAGLKTGSLFTCEADDRSELSAQIRQLNLMLAPKGIRIMILGFPREDRALIYLFRIDQLKTDLQSDGTSALLRSRGYDPSHMGQCLSTLIHKLKDYDEFPHEIGCFLGYPYEDVCGFIQHRRPYKAVGTWQVFGDVDEALKKFEMYRRCTDSYLRQFEHGTAIEQLAVAKKRRKT